ncbi:MAG: hypothetical protein ACHQEB_00460 [Chitinophagales bacterium]
MQKRIIILFLTVFVSVAAVIGQKPLFSIATDFDIQHSFKKGQRYWAIGQAVQGHFHFTPKEGVYLWISYYSDGKFSNDLTADAKSGSTNPQQINYVNSASMRFKHFSVGWKHYLKGAYDIDGTWNLYGYAGFGLMMGRVINIHSVLVDTSMYAVPVLSGQANFKRLTLDLGLGGEVPIGGSVYFYAEGRALVPTTDYPSDHIFINKNAPFVASINFGVRILFD